MRISIVIPVYNVEQYILGCIMSVADQDWKGGEIECIIVDDCGQDASIPIVENFIRSYKGGIKFCILHHDYNRGLSAARNTGMAAVTGDYLFFLDGDDELTPDCISILTAPLLFRSYDIVIGDFLFRLGGGKEVPKLRVRESMEFLGDDIRNAFLRRVFYSMAWNKLYNLKFLKTCGILFYEGICHEDELWHVEISCLAESLYVVKHVSYIYNKNLKGITAILDGERKKRRGFFREILVQLDHFYKERHLVEDHIARKMYYLTFFTFCKIFYECSDVNEARENYFTLRKICDAGLADLAVTGNFHKMLRDFHFILPEKIGYALYLRQLKLS